MVLVGEAAKKLDKYTGLFHELHAKSVTELKEYKHLQEFYLNRIARKIDEGTLGKWILALAHKITPKKIPMKFVGRKSSQTKHVFIDLEAVKKDTEYELFFLRKEDGTRFFSPRLIRNIKLVCDFGDYFGKPKGDDPLIDIKIWHDRCFQASSKSLLRAIRPIVDRFFREAAHCKDNELVMDLTKACMALILCSNPNNLMRNMPVKNCTSYFNDFELFIRAALHSPDYQRLIAYPPKKSSKLSNMLLDTAHAICCAYFTALQGYQELAVPFQHLIQEAIQDVSQEHVIGKNSHELWSKIAGEYAAMAKLFKHHPNGPLMNVLNVLQDGDYNSFDPLYQNNIPNQLYSIYFNEAKVSHIRMPAPIFQEYIHKATIVEEFKGFLRALNKNSVIDKLLIFNFQDRTSWREHIRCIAMEDLQKKDDFQQHLAVVTMAKDTEFFQQQAPYQDENHANIFIENLKDQIADENSGFYFPDSIKKGILNGFLGGTVDAIHRIFFSNKNVLLREHRLAFIEIL